MLAQLRLQYPQGCLVSELLEIKHGKYIVRVLVQVEGVTIATSLGAGETVELAEDRARERILAILDLGTMASREAIAPVIPATPVIAAPVVTPSVVVPLAPVVAAPVIQPVVTEIPAPEVKTPADVSFVEPQPKVEEAIIQEAVSLPEAPPPTPTPPAPTIEKTEKVIPLHIVPDTQPVETYHQPLVAVVPDLEASDFSTEKEEKKAKTKTSSVAIPDIKDVMARTEIEIRRLGWTTQQGRNFLLQRYGKRARTLLSDEELLDFLSYLEEQPVAE